MIKVTNLFLVVVTETQRSEYSQRFPFNSSEVKQHKECSQ